MKWLLLVSIIFMSGNLYASPSANGRQAVDSAGTPERLTSSSSWCNAVTVTAFEANTDVVVIGKSDVDATEATRTGLALFPGQTEYLFGRTDIRDTWIDSEVNGEGASFACFN